MLKQFVCGQVVGAIVSSMMTPFASCKIAELTNIVTESRVVTGTQDFAALFSGIPRDLPGK